MSKIKNQQKKPVDVPAYLPSKVRKTRSIGWDLRLSSLHYISL